MAIPVALLQHVVGVVNDYVYGDMYGKSDPVIFFVCNAENTTTCMCVLKPKPMLKRLRKN